MKYSHISVAIPMLAELENLPALLHNLTKQTFKDYDLYFCINNPASWATTDRHEEYSMYENNMETLCLLEKEKKRLGLQMTIMNCQWQGKQQGVGWARKALFEEIARCRGENELVVSLDADTSFDYNYFDSLLDTFNDNPNCCAMAVPYYHRIIDNDRHNRAMLRYEIYMRHYLINLLEIAAKIKICTKNTPFPYSFTALGSAIVFPLWAYRRVGGITPLQGGEDFYLMQKYAKTGRIMLHCNGSKVYPSARPSNRVPFGTGPAIAKGIEIMDDIYPLYPYEGFDAIAETYSMFPHLFYEDIETPMSQFLHEQLKTDNLWGPIRKNFKTMDLFVHSCQERVDGLRILQFLKTFPRRSAEKELSIFCRKRNIHIDPSIDFKATPIDILDSVRNLIVAHELELRRIHDSRS